MRNDILLGSVETLADLTEALSRSKFDAFVSRQTRMAALLDFRRSLHVIEIANQVRACRDPSDDQFPSLAISGHADLIISGDADLLVLHPFRGIDIVFPRDYIRR